MPAAPALPELEALDLDDFDTGFAHLGDRVRVALVSHDDARLQGHHVVAVIPLLALLLIRVSTAPMKSFSTVTSNSPLRLPGRRLIALMLPTTFG